MVTTNEPDLLEPEAYPASKWGSWLTYLYLLRVPLLLGLVLVGLPLAALLNASPLRVLFENLFYLSAPATLLTTVVEVALAWSLLLTARVVLLNGELRFDVEQVIRQKDFRWWIWWVPLGLAAPAVAGPFFKFGQLHGGWSGVWRNALAAAAGVAISYLLGYASVWLAILLSPKGCQPEPDTFPALEPMRNGLVWANHHTVLPGSLLRWMAGVLKRLPLDLQAGYLDNRPWRDGEVNAGYNLPWASHWLELSFALLTFLLYLLIDAYKIAHLGETIDIPALAMVLFLLINLNWVLSCLTFLLDRFRLPLLIPLGLFAVLGTYFPSADHYYEIHPGAAVSALRPREALVQRIASEKPIILVATAGGGIQAAAWTARVLTGLQHESLAWNHGSFADSVALISSVSGGATGSLFFLNQYTSSPGKPGFHLPDQDGNYWNLVESAATPALDDIAWALVYRDLPAIFLPWTPAGELLDRGRMLELTWQRKTRNFGNLSSWRDGVKDGWRPAAIFNATIAETGEPLLLATTDLDRGRPGTLPDRKMFYDLYPGADIPLVTAVRLAASFPYVSPAARAETLPPEYHVIDGGYYDNYGVASLAEWLDEAFTDISAQAGSPPIPDVLVIQIRSFPDDPLPAPENRGWFFQAHAPVTGLLSVRTTAQLVRDRDDLDLLQRRWGADGQGLPHIRFAEFQFSTDDAPLSWEMNQSQMEAIELNWSRLVHDNGKSLRQVRCMFDPSGADCATLAREVTPWEAGRGK